MSETRETGGPASLVPGIAAVHAIVTPTCRANRGPHGAFDEAVARLWSEYTALLSVNQTSNFHVVLTVERQEGQ